MKFRITNGFTLIEVLIAMAIIGIGLVTLLTLFPVGLRSSRLAGDFTTAAFIGQQALDNIRASAQTYDPGDGYFDNSYNEKSRAINGANSTNHNGLGYYELPVSAVKGYFSPLRFPTPPSRSQDWIIKFIDSTTYNVTGSSSGAQTYTGTLGIVYTSDNKEISFVLYENKTGEELGTVALATGPYDPIYDVVFPLATGGPRQEYDDFAAGDQIVIHIEMRAGVPYYWYAMRAPVTEDQDLDGILDGWVPDSGAAPNYVTIRPAPHNTTREDTGLDLVPDYWDINNTGTYEYRLDRDGEFSASALFPIDPHGDNKFLYANPSTGSIANPSILANIANPNGTEGNGRIDAHPDGFMQKVTVMVGWREGSQDRTATFSTTIPNQFR